jgi:hypothetical protein
VSSSIGERQQCRAVARALDEHDGGWLFVHD